MDAGNGSWYRATGDLDENKPFTWTSGYRIVDLCEFAKQMRCKKCSSLLDLNNTQNETRFGLASVLSVLCYDCRTLNDVCTGKAQRTREGEAMFEINMKTSVNMLLNGIGAQYVIHFLAVLDIPVPMQDDAFMVMPSSPGDVTPLQTPQPPAVESPGGVTQTPILTSPPPTSSSQVCQPVNLSGTTTTGGSSAQNSDDLLVQLDDIKHEAMQGLSNTESLTRSSQNEKQQNKPKAEKQQPIVSSVKSVVSASQSGGADLDDTEECSSFDPPAEKEDVLPFFENSTQRKYYRCPLCPRVLPSIRGFQVHVARKHQASQFRAEHHVLGPDAGYTGDKAQDAIDAEPAAQLDSTQTSGPNQPSTRASGKDTLSSASSQPVEDGDMGVAETPEDDEATEVDEPEPEEEQGPRRRSSKRRKGKDSSGPKLRSKLVCRIRNCNKQFKTEALYQKHLQKVHSVNSPFSCKQCGQEYTSQKSLNVHFTVAHRTKEERKAVCKYCGETLLHARALKKHIKAKHPRGSKQTFYCDECPKTFSLACALKTHKLRHSGVKNYKCFYCDMWFAGSGNRLSHIRYIHEKERRFLCDTCGASFYKAHVLREHERVHSGEKPFQCERCAERFRTKEYLTIHMRTHTGERPYKCELCNKAFSQRCSRTLHRRKVHGIQKQGGTDQKLMSFKSNVDTPVNPYGSAQKEENSRSTADMSMAAYGISHREDKIRSSMDTTVTPFANAQVDAKFRSHFDPTVATYGSAPREEKIRSSVDAAAASYGNLQREGKFRSNLDATVAAYGAVGRDDKISSVDPTVTAYESMRREEERKQSQFMKVYTEMNNASL